MSAMEAKRWRSWRAWLRPAAIVAICALGAAIAVWGPSLFRLITDKEALRRLIEDFGAWGPLVFMLLQAAQVLVAPIPGHILAVVSGSLFGPWMGTLYTVIGVGAGSGLVLLLSRAFGRPLVVRLVPQQALPRIDTWAARRGPLFFFVLFMLPFMPDDIACFAIGLSALPLLPMLAVIVLARFPGHFISAWLGANVERFPLAGWVILGIGGLGFAGLYWRYREPLEEWMLARLPGARQSEPAPGATDRENRSISR